MPLFKVSVESQVPVSAVVTSTAPTEAEALAEVRLLQSRARVNWRRGLTPIGAIEAPYEIWAHRVSDGSFTVSLYASIIISAIQTTVAEDEETVRQAVADRQASGLVQWKYRGIPVGDYREPIPTYWSNQQPDIVTLTVCFLSTSSTYPGQSVILSADISGSEVPVGNLEFKDANTGTVIVPTTLEADPVTPGLAHAQAVVVLPAGSYGVQAAFLGSDGYQASLSSIIALTIAKISTTVVITPPAPPVYAGQSVSLSIVVNHAVSSAPKPTGTLTLFQGTTVTGSTQLDTSGGSSTGSFSLGTLPPGVYSFTVQYEGDDIHNGSSAVVSGITVLQAPTTNVLSVVQPGTPVVMTSSTFSQTVRLQAVLTSGVPGTVPTGNVTFKEGVTTLGVAALVPAPSLGDNAAMAFMDKSDFPVGVHASLSTSYAGNASFAASDSGAVSLTVNKASVTVNAFSSNSPTKFGQTAVFDATVDVQLPGVITPFQQYGMSGSVTYKDASVVVVNFDGTGHAGRSVGSLPVGTNEVGVTFASTAEFNSGFASFPHVVEKASTVSFVDSIIPNPTAWYEYFTIFGEVNVVAPGVGSVAGTMNFSIYDPWYWGDLFLGSAPVVAGQASLFTTFFASVTDYYQVTVTYVESANFLSSSASDVVLIYGFYF